MKESLRSRMLSFGWIAPVIYIRLFIVRPFTLFPASVLSLAGGLAFGTGWGSAYTILGEIPGTIAYAFQGASLSHGGWQRIALAAAVLLAAMAVPFFFRSKVERQVNGAPSAARKLAKAAR